MSEQVATSTVEAPKIPTKAVEDLSSCTRQLSSPYLNELSGLLGELECVFFLCRIFVVVVAFLVFGRSSELKSLPCLFSPVSPFHPLYRLSQQEFLDILCTQREAFDASITEEVKVMEEVVSFFVYMIIYRLFFVPLVNVLPEHT